MKSDSTINWLLDKDQPSIRYLTLTQLLERTEGDPEVKAARRAIIQRGWAKEILDKQDPAGWWISEESLYRPKYVSTNWMLLILSDLGLTKEDPRVAKACQIWMRRFAKRRWIRHRWR